MKGYKTILFGILRPSRNDKGTSRGFLSSRTLSSPDRVKLCIIDGMALVHAVAAKNFPCF